MNKAQLVSAIAERLEWSRSEAAEAVDAVITIVTETVADGEPVTITGFAKFYRQDRAERMGRNPATGEAIKIPAKRVAKITALKTFKEQVLANGRARKRTARR
jgi:DNA-binding protein HU-beta